MTANNLLKHNVSLVSRTEADLDALGTFDKPDQVNGRNLPIKRYWFEQVEVQTDERRLFIDGKLANLGPRAFDVLLCLLARAGSLVSKEELLNTVWPRLVVEENNLQVQVSALRKLFGGQAIATVAGQGYRFNLPVRHDAQLTSTNGGQTDPLQQPSSASNLPRNLGALIGRNAELAQLQKLVMQHRLVTVTGAGGVGKTRLMLEAARHLQEQFTAGVWLIELASLNQDEQVANSIAATLQVEVKAGCTATQALILKLREQALLLVLDNCEHLVEAVASFAHAILSATDHIALLTSSQEILGLSEEQVFRLPSLSLPSLGAQTAQQILNSDAVQLFEQRARAADMHFQLDDQAAPIVASICHRLDGIALAIEMAAARVPSLGIDVLAQLLDERFQVLTGGRRSALPRHRTLHATLDWSHGLLNAAEAVVFRRIGILIGGFGLAAAVAVARDTTLEQFAVIDCIASLVDKSLLVADVNEGHVRYRLLESTRAYALEKLAAADEMPFAAQRCAEYFRQLFLPCFDDWTRLTDLEFEARYTPEIDNLRQSIDYSFSAAGNNETGLALVGCSGQLWVGRWLFYEADQRVEFALSRLQADTDAKLAGDLWMTCATLCYFHRNERAIPASQHAVAYFRQTADPLRLGNALILLGCCYAVSGRAEALESLQEARQLLQSCMRPRIEASLHKSFGTCYAVQGQSQQAAVEYQQALVLSLQIGAQFQALTIQEDLADVYWMQGDLDRALQAALDTVESCRQSRFAYKVSWGWVLGNLFGILTERGDLQEALAVGREALPFLREFATMWVVMDHYSLRLAKIAQWQAAAHVSGWSDAAFEKRGTLRQPNEKRAHDSTLKLLRTALTEEQLQQWRAAGALLSDEQLCALALL